MLPEFLEAYLRMDTMALRKWCSPVLHRHMSEVIRNQKAAGLQMDPNVLALEEVNMLMAKPRDKESPALILSFAAQQVHCIRNREGEVVEGKEDLIQQHIYVAAFSRDYVEEGEDAGLLKWQVIEFAPQFTQEYI